ncbi:MAG: hypothetical protein BMS9Abin26_1610 [Gammaproteobacteria bacterium]|nr:MAG: hypothetical protein BMS9Abin26_1610 [Gammaproteobacteria bacterium]
MKNSRIITSPGNRNRVFLLLVLPAMILLMGSLAACQQLQTQPSPAGPDTTAIRQGKINNRDDRSHQELIANKELAIGFTREQVKMAWGEPEYRKKPEDLYDENNRKVNPSAADNIETWYYTVTTRQPVYVLKRHINDQTGAVEFREESQGVLQEHVTRMVGFKEDKVILWRIYPATGLLKPVKTKPVDQ